MSATLSAATISELVAKGKAKNPQLSARLDRAAAIIMAGEYKPTSDPDTIEIRGYHVNGSCSCPDYKHGAPIIKDKPWCKHRLAKLMLDLVAADEPAPVRSESPDLFRQAMAWQAFAQSDRK